MRTKYQRRSFPVRKGDKVKILRGKFKRIIGEIERIDTKNYRVYVKGAEKKLAEGRKIDFPIAVSNINIITLNLNDKKRVQALERNIKKQKTQSKATPRTGGATE